MLKGGATAIFKAVSILTISYAAVQAVPLMGDTMATHSVALLKRTKEPIFQKSAAKRMNSIAINDERRRFLISLGGIRILFRVLSDCDNEGIIHELCKTLENLLQSDEAVNAIEFDSDIAALNHAMSVSKNEATQLLIRSTIDKLHKMSSQT